MKTENEILTETIVEFMEGMNTEELLEIYQHVLETVKK